MYPLRVRQGVMDCPWEHSLLYSYEGAAPDPGVNGGLTETQENATSSKRAGANPIRDYARVAVWYACSAKC